MLHPHVPEDIKSFGKHLFATFLGLLMALGLEQWREHRHEAKVAAAALVAVEAELKENQDRIQLQLKRCADSLATLEAITTRLDSISTAVKQKGTPDASPMPTSIGVGLGFTPDAWDSFKAQGLLRCIPQERTRRLSRFHRMARTLPELAHSNFSGGDALMEAAILVADGPETWAKLPETDREKMRHGIKVIRNYFTWAANELKNLDEACREAAQA